MKDKLSIVILGFITCCACYPIVFLIVGSFMGETELKGNLSAVLGSGVGEYIKWSLLPLYPTLRSYVKILLDTPDFFHMFWNSTYISFAIIALQLAIATPCAWGFSQENIPQRKKLFFIYIIFMLLPFQVLMLPEYLTLKKLNMLNSFAAIILPNAFATFPVFIMYYFFKSIPNTTIEAARMDGASEWRIFFKIGVPLGKSGILSALLLSFFESWNLIEQPLLFLEDKKKWPLSLQLPNISLNQADVAIVSSVITLILPILLFLTFQKELEEGIAASAMKE